MKVEINLYAFLARLMPVTPDGKPYRMDVEEGMTVRDLLRSLQVPEEDVKILFLNGIHASGDEILKDGDRIGVFPPVAGG